MVKSLVDKANKRSRSSSKTARPRAPKGSAPVSHGKMVMLTNMFEDVSEADIVFIYVANDLAAMNIFDTLAAKCELEGTLLGNCSNVTQRR